MGDQILEKKKRKAGIKLFYKVCSWGPFQLGFFSHFIAQQQQQISYPHNPKIKVGFYDSLLSSLAPANEDFLKINQDFFPSEKAFLS